MLVLRRQEELGGQFFVQIVRKYIVIAISGRSGGREGRAGPGAEPPHFSTAGGLKKKRHDYMRRRASVVGAKGLQWPPA